MPSPIHRLLCVLAIATLAYACAAPTNTSKTLHDPAYASASFRNFLVIAVGENYDARAQFERQLVSAINSSGGSATAYYTIVGNKPTLTREDIGKAISDGKFDAVLVTRVKRMESKVDVVTGAADTKTTRRSGSAFDLFRYDYEELNDPDSVEISTSITVVTELYVAADQKKIWAIESFTESSGGAGVLIDREVETISRQLRKDRLIGS